MKIIIITGGKGKGKTTFLRNFLKNIKFSSNNLFGFFAENFNNTDEYILENVTSGERYTLCKRNAAETGSLKLQDFWFDENTIKIAEEWINTGFSSLNPVFIIDEIGKFEIEGFIWNNIFRKILKFNKGLLIITVREKFIKQLIDKFELRRMEIEIVSVE